HGTFTFSRHPNHTTADTDVVKYHSSLDGAPGTTLTPDTPGGSGSVRLMPARSGRRLLAVVAIAREAHATSTPDDFLVSEGKPVGAQWNLADQAGDTEAHDE
ncbi:hypothetical protein ADL01_26705, partial [Streptomyces sp. NRRL WC-3618]